jgi:hypothetical protein
MLTCRSRQRTGSPGEEGVGKTLLTVAVGFGRPGVLTSVGEEVQADKTNRPTNRILIIGFM